MKKIFLSINPIATLYIFSIIFISNCKINKKFINHTIKFYNDVNNNEAIPYITMKKGGKELKFIISLSSPLIILKEDNSNSGHNSEYLNLSNVYTLFNYDKTNTANFSIQTSNDNFNFDSYDENFTYGQIIDPKESKENFNLKEFGLYGLAREQQIKDEKLYHLSHLNQLYKKNLISHRKIIYIKPYYKNGTLLEESAISIGKFPDEFVKNKTKLPSCRFKKNFPNYYACEITDIILKNKNSEEKFQMNNLNIKARFEEGKFSKINLPSRLFKDFSKFFEGQNCTIDNNSKTIYCDEKSEKYNIIFSIVMNKFEFVIKNNKTLWDKNGFLNMEFNMRENNTAILTSGFSGNYHRIYDNFNERIYFSDEDGNIKFPHKKNKKKIYWIIYLIISGAILVIGLIVIIIVWTTTKKNIEQEVTSISFQRKRDEEEDDDDDDGGGQILF